MKKVVFFIATAFFLVLASLSCKAQSFRCHGNVSVDVVGVAVPGATVKLLDSDVSTTTDEDGDYSINLPSWNITKVLKASFVGCLPDLQLAKQITNFKLAALDLVTVLRVIMGFRSLLHSEAELPEGYGPDGAVSVS